MNTQSKLIAAMSLCAIIAVPNIASAASVSGQGTWESTLQGRDLDGNLATAEAYYDTVLDITWLADANYAKTSGYDSDGRMLWPDANAWADGLTFGGYTDWRLPTVTPVNGTSFNFTYNTDGTTDVGTATTTTDGSDGGWRDDSGTPVSEMGHMFYVTLGNIGLCDPSLPPCTVQSGRGLSNTGPFSNVQAGSYWSGPALSSFSAAWRFGFDHGFQLSVGNTANFFAWAVHSGDVGTPIPAVLDVMIDIKPGSNTNPVNPRSKVKLIVAILTSETFDASTVDVGTVQFGPGSAAPVWYRLDDVDDDGNWDLVLKFNTQDTGIACDDTEATLTAKTFNGIEIIGTDSVKTKGCTKQ